MQSKGIIKWLALLLGVACIWQLSFTFVARSVEKDAVAYAEKMAAEAVATEKANLESLAKAEADATVKLEQFVAEAELAQYMAAREEAIANYIAEAQAKAAEAEAIEMTVEQEEELQKEAEMKADEAVKLADYATEAQKAEYQETYDKYVADYIAERWDEKDVYNKAFAKNERVYLEKIWDEEVYNLGFVKYTYGDCKSKELNLGLDLRGGMNVMLEVKPSDVIRVDVEKCEKYQNDEVFNKKMEEAIHAASKKDDVDEAIAAFVDKCSEEDLNEVFGTTNKDNIKKSVSERVDKYTDDVLASLESRIDALGVVQPNIQRVVGTNRISVELPGVKEPERVKKLLASSATLEFWAVGTQNDINHVSRVLTSGEFDEVINAQLDKIRPGLVADKEDIESINEALNHPDVKNELRDYKLAWENKSIDGKNYGDFRLVVLKGKEPLMDGSGITDARAQSDDKNGGMGVSITMEGDAVKRWATITKNYVGRPIAIVMDGTVFSAPNVNNPIENGSSVITGNFSVQEAEDLANVLNAGKSPVTSTIVYSEVVGPSLGEKAVNSGLISFAIAFILVLLYMAFFYRTAGWMANIALLFNVLLLMGVLVSFGAVLTLPGIAGIVLTMGMAVDANVIIFERIKEELRAGKGLGAAIKDGFSNAYSAIIDGNLTTIITGVVLFFLGSGPVKGFATTLIVGIITSLFCAIFITRVLLEWWAERRGGISFSRKITENFLQNVKFDFISKRKYSYIISGVLMVASVISLFTLGLNKGVEFTGGRTYIVKFDKTVDVEAVRENITEAFEAVGDAANTSVEVKQFGDDNQVRIVTQFEPSDEVVKSFIEARGAEFVGEAIDESFVIEYMIYEATKEFYEGEYDFLNNFRDNDATVGITQSSQVGSSISGEMTLKSIIAVLIALVAIGIYIAIRFRRWQWALGATFALFQNALLVLGIFSMCYAFMPFNLEVNQAFIAAILTIVGYSINDTVIVFDRIREYMGLYPKRDMKKNMNDAICNTLSRTINTSGTTLVTLLSIFIFGGESIRGFVFALIIGVVIGTLSSIFIASPIAYDLQRKKAAKQAAEQKEE